jgi:histidinol-phosphate/aromatic aminotransferase/cobyric acid decarboxylase-like protein
VYNALREQKLLVRWWSSPELGTKLRITVGRPDQNNRLLAALRQVMAA